MLNNFKLDITLTSINYNSVLTLSKTILGKVIIFLNVIEIWTLRYHWNVIMSTLPLINYKYDA